MAGRPSKYTEERGEQILSLYAQGKTILQITKLKGMPSRITIYNWRTAYPEFGKAYDLAVECNADYIVEKAYNKVENASSAEAKLVDVQFKSTSWLASKLNRNKYGDKIDIDITKTLDISPALADAVKRMASVGVGEPQKVLVEGENSDTNTM